MKKISWTVPLVLTCVSIPFVGIAGIFPLMWLVAFPLVVLSLIFECILHYKCWEVLQPNQRRTTPGKAVGFQFIPFYNFYWVFVCYRGLQIDLGNAANKPNEGGLGTALAIVWICALIVSFVPILDFFAGAAYFVLWILFTRKVVADANSILASSPPSLPPQPI